MKHVRRKEYQVQVISGNIAEMSVDAVVVNLFEGVQQPGGATGAMDRALEGAISQLIADGDIKGKYGETTLVHSLGKIRAKRVIVVGLGKPPEFTLDRARNLSAEVARYLRRIGTQRAATIVHGAGIGGLDPEAACQALVEGIILGLYRFRELKTGNNDDDKDLREFSIVEMDASKLAELDRGAERGRILAEATNVAKDMCNRPANLMTPTDMANVAQDVASRYGLECKVFGKDEIAKMGMGALLGVAQGSEQPPKFITLSYNGGPEASGRPTLGLLGKGVTFDSGGISLKPADGMANMKTDMSGGAAVIGAMQAIAQLKPKINVMGIVPATENLPGGCAVKPGDILKSMSGKSIEVVNTDAEGRLILSDAIAYAKQQNLRPLVDVATLTGACSVALGPYYSGVMGNNQEAIYKVLKAAKVAGEKMWQLPMDDDYKELIRSDVGDIKNSATGRAGGAITAAHFLAEFSGDTPWVHLDIAPTARSDRDRGAISKGSTGVATRTLVQLALMLASEE